MMLSIIYEVASLPTESEKDNTTQSVSKIHYQFANLHLMC